MFPHLVAGPIVRFASINEDLENRKRDRDLFSYGVFRFILGVNKKVLIANSVAPLADIAFLSHLTQLGTLEAWVGLLAYTVQIYFDFSGYSDMAIGLAAMIGIRFDENFHSPYKAKSIREFWRRWHMSLSTWLRDYLYIPLGGSRVSQIVNYRNLIIVFFLCGLWHGAQFTFVIWGLFHGALLILERTTFGDVLEKLPSAIQHVYAVFMVMVSWVFFRAESLPQSLHYFKSLFTFRESTLIIHEFGWLNVATIVIGFILIGLPKEFVGNTKEKLGKEPLWLFVINAILFVVSIGVLYTANRNPFIYFNF